MIRPILGVTIVGIAVLSLIAFSIAISSWLLMLLLGAFAHVANISKAALGFWPCVILVIIVGIFFDRKSK